MFAYLGQSPVMGRARVEIDPKSPKAVGKRLQALRMGLGYTQAFMARRLGSSTSGQMWANYEAGRIPPHPTVQRIAQLFGVSILWIYDGREDQLNLEQARTIQLGEVRIEEGWRPRRIKSR